MRTVQDYCRKLLWSISDLAHEARINWQTASRAFYQEPVQARTRRDICSALTTALHKPIGETDIEWQAESEGE